jgi:hypothetical protein
MMADAALSGLLDAVICLAALFRAGWMRLRQIE